MIETVFSYIRNRKADAQVQVHTHNLYEFIYFYSGEGEFFYDGVPYMFSPGSYYLMAPDIPHSEIYRAGGKSLVTQFNIPQYILRSVLQNDAKLNLHSLAEKIRTEIKRKLFNYEDVVYDAVDEIMVLLYRQQNLEKNLPWKSIDNSIAYLDAYYMTNINIDELARESNYSADHFRILFKERTGCAPKEFMLQKRLELAKEQLGNTNYSIEEICKNCGFEYYSQFAVFFKKRTGVAPGEYRRNARRQCPNN